MQSASQVLEPVRNEQPRPASDEVADIAVIGAGPYGLSMAAHLNDGPLSFRIFGVPMRTWREHMPKGMMLKSDGFASNIADPADRFTLKSYCAANGIGYNPNFPPSLSVFVDYGLDFQRNLVPFLESHEVVSLESIDDGYKITLDNGAVAKSRKVILAVGITYFNVIPDEYSHLPSSHVSHSADHSDPGALSGKSVAVIGSGASAVGLAALMCESGVDVHLITRAEKIVFHSAPSGAKRSLWARLRRPSSGIGPGLKSRLMTDFPDAWRFLPLALRWKIFRNHLGPSSDFHMKSRFSGVKARTSTTVSSAEFINGKVRLDLSCKGYSDLLDVDHIIVATGYPPDFSRISFIAPNLRKNIRTEHGFPVLDGNFETTATGLYVVGLSSALSFGPMFRFAFGARWAARRLCRHLFKSHTRALTGRA